MSKKTYILLAPGTGLVKIGCSADPLARVQRLRTLNAARVELLTVMDIPEADLHKAFADTRDHGEWFKISRGMVLFFNELEECEAALLMGRELDRGRQA